MMGYQSVFLLVAVVAIATEAKDPTALPEVCGGRLKGDSGSFSSPANLNKPVIYLTNVTCAWHIKIPYDSSVTIRFTKFKTEGCCDYVKMTTKEGRLIGQFGGITTPHPVTIMSDETRRLDIFFHSDATVAKEGFTAHYSIRRNVAPTKIPSAATAAPPHGMSLVSTFQTLSNALTRIIHSSDKNMVPKTPSRDQILIFKSDLSDAMAQLMRLRSLASSALSKDEQDEINIGLKHLNSHAKHLIRRMSKQVSPYICRLPKKVGPCRGAFSRWFFDKRKLFCRSFIFGGCQPNANNFMTKQDCEALCKPAQPSTTLSPRASTTPSPSRPASTTPSATHPPVTTKYQSTMCPPGVHVCYAIMSPCVAQSCKAYPLNQCKANYCGGCNAEFYDRHGYRISAQACRCPLSKKPVPCFGDPCQFSRCHRHPDAKCRARSCGACTAEFVDSKGKVITDCRKKNKP